jgi:hypothetical protein
MAPLPFGRHLKLWTARNPLEKFVSVHSFPWLSQLSFNISSVFTKRDFWLFPSSCHFRKVVIWVGEIFQWVFSALKSNQKAGVVFVARGALQFLAKWAVNCSVHYFIQGGKGRGGGWGIMGYDAVDDDEQNLMLYHCNWAPLKPSDSDFGQNRKPGTREIPRSQRVLGCMTHRQSTYHLGFDKPVELHWWTCGDKVIGYDRDAETESQEPWKGYCRAAWSNVIVLVYLDLQDDHDLEHVCNVPVYR